ncbi:HD domain-containing protein [Patescibacteria group bacterium]|nr:HD domain-containing protein [Patescibacteria group bacterium]
MSDDPILRYAALYHDVGKVEQYSTYSMGLDQEEVREVFGTWLNHVVCGAEFAREDFKVLGMSSKESEQIGRYVANHMKIGEIMNATVDNQRKKIRNMISDVGPDMVKNLCLLTIADRTGQYNPLQPPVVDAVKAMMDMVDQLMAEEGRFTMAQLAVDGNDLMTLLKLSP